MIRYYLIITGLLLTILWSPIAALASDISNALYYGIVLVTNNSTTATGVATTSNISTTNLVNGGYLNAATTNGAVRNSSGVDVPFMPGYTPDDNPWCFWVPSIGADSILTYLLYTANSTGGEYRYFPGADGMDVADDAGLELSDNFTVEVSGYFDTSTSAVGGNITDKPNAFRIILGSSENITASILGYNFTDGFDADAWTDVGTKIVVDTTDSRLEYEAERSAVDTRCYYDLGAGIISDTAWRLDFAIHPISRDNDGVFYFGLYETPANESGYPDDAILLDVNQADLFRIRRLDEGAGGVSSGISYSYGTTYYISLMRVSSSNVTLGAYSDAARTIHIAGSPVSLAVPATVVGLRYLQASNYNDNSGADWEQIGWIDSLGLNFDSTFGEAVVSATSVSSGEHKLEVYADTANLTIEIDDVVKDSIALLGGSVYDNSANWTFCEAAVMPYMETASITIDGVLQGSWEWEYDTTFTDLAGNGHDATPSFRTTSSNAGTSASLSRFLPVSEAKAPSYALEDAPDFIDADALTGNITSTFGTTPAAGAGTFPLANVITTIANASSTPPQLPLLIIAGFIILAASLTISATIRRYGSGSLIIKIIVIVALMGIFVALGDFAIEFWMIVVFLIIAIAVAFASRQLGWT